MSLGFPGGLSFLGGRTKNRAPADWALIGHADWALIGQPRLRVERNGFYIERFQTHIRRRGAPEGGLEAGLARLIFDSSSY